MIWRVLTAFLLLTLLGCDSGQNAAPTNIAQCEAFDQRCLPCEAAGEGEPCAVGESFGVCTLMRVVEGLQVYISGLRCLED